jgi:hypothetical protein
MLVRIARSLPAWLYDRIMTRVAKRIPLPY